MTPAAQFIVLHSHCTASDGQYPVEEVAERAVAAGLAVWSLSDHDTVAALPAAAGEAKKRGMRFVPGIELSAFVNGREIHVLGHFVDPAGGEIGRLSEVLRQKRWTRM